MKGINKSLRDAVVQEALLIRTTAKKSEIKKLIVKRVRPQEYDMCIYGLMTGDCRSNRAIELIDACTIKVVSRRFTEGFDSNMPQEDINKIRAKKKTKDCNIADRAVYIQCFSPIEAAIIVQPEIIPKIIDIIKGNSGTL